MVSSPQAHLLPRLPLQLPLQHSPFTLQLVPVLLHATHVALVAVPLLLVTKQYPLLATLLLPATMHALLGLAAEEQVPAQNEVQAGTKHCASKPRGRVLGRLGQSELREQPQVLDMVLQTAPFVLLVQSVFERHWTQVPVAPLQRGVEGLLLQSSFVRHCTQVFVWVLQTVLTAGQDKQQQRAAKLGADPENLLFLQLQ